MKYIYPPSSGTLITNLEDYDSSAYSLADIILTIMEEYRRKYRIM